MSAPSMHHDAPTTCLRCSYPVETDVSIFKILDHLSDMVQLAGYSVDRLHLQRESPSAASSAAAQTVADRDHLQSDHHHQQQQQQQHQQQKKQQQELLSVTLSLRRSTDGAVHLGKRPRSAVESTDQHNQLSKRMAMTNTCRMCASSCCSTNSLCKAHVCNHHNDNEETSAPSPSSPVHQPYITRPNQKQESHAHSRGSQQQQPTQNVDQHRPSSQTHVAVKQSHSQLESGAPVGPTSNSNTNLQNSNHRSQQHRHHVHRGCSQAQNVNTVQKYQHVHSKSHHHHHHHTGCHVHRRARSQPPPPPVPPPLPAPPPLPNLASTETVSQPVDVQRTLALDLTKHPQTPSQARNSQPAAQKTTIGERQQMDQSHLQNRPQQKQETQQLLPQQTPQQAPQPLLQPKHVQPQPQPQLQPVQPQPQPSQPQPLQLQQQQKAPQQQSHQGLQQKRQQASQQLQKTAHPNKLQRAEIGGTLEEQAHVQGQVQSLTQVQVQGQSAGHSTQLVQLSAQNQPQPQTQVEVQLSTTAQNAQTGSAPSPAHHGIPDVIMITEDITGNQALDEAVHAANIGSISPATASATLSAAAALVGKGAAERWISSNTSTPGQIQVSDPSVLVGATATAEPGTGNDPESATATPSVELAPNNVTTTGNVITDAGSQEDSEIEKNSKEQQEGAESVVVKLEGQVSASRRRSSTSKSTAVTVAPRPLPDLTCKLCPKLFENELELRRHEFVDHKEERLVSRTSEGRYYCLMHSCTQTFVRRHVMERHFKTVHLMVRDFPCEKCDRAFADSSTREAHLSAVHEKRKPWVCTQCSSSFTQSSSLGKHIRRFHSGTVAANAAVDGNDSLPMSHQQNEPMSHPQQNEQ